MHAALLLLPLAVQSFDGAYLDDLGNGSCAVTLDQEDGQVLAAGSYVLDDRTVPVVWRVDPAELTSTVEELPLPAGASGSVESIAIDFTGFGVVLGVAAGTLTTDGGTDRAAVWRQDLGGAWSYELLPDLGSGGHANGIWIDFPGAGVVGDVVESDGRVRPHVWTEELGGWSPQPLALPPIAEGTVRGILIDNEIVASYRFVGDASAPTLGIGPLPLVWDLELGAGPGALDLVDLPVGIEGTAHDVAVDAGGFDVAVGLGITPDEIEHALVWKEIQPSTWAWVLLPDAGFGSRCTALAVDAAGTGRCVGSAENAAGRTLPLYWTVDLTTGATDARVLPVPSGEEGAAHAILIETADVFLGPAPEVAVIAGTTTQGGVERAAVWVETGP